MRPHDRTPDRWTASRTLPEPQTQQTHNAELKGTNRQQNSEDDDAATQEPTGTRETRHAHGQCTPLPPPGATDLISYATNTTHQTDTHVNLAQIRTDRTQDCEIAVKGGLKC